MVYDILEFIYTQRNVLEVSNFIYKVFKDFNYRDSTDKLRSRMELLYWSWFDYNRTLDHLKKSEIFLVAMDNWKIIWLVRWKKEKITNLYVDWNYQWKWIWKLLLEAFESYAKKFGSTLIILKPSSYAKNFYLHNWYTFIDEKYMKKNI